MDFLTMLHISKTGLTTQRTTMNVIASNLANMSTTRTTDGMPYRRKIAVIESEPVEDFESILDGYKKGYAGAKVGRIKEDTSPFRQLYDPGHPDANDQGYVSFPNVNFITETTHMMQARRSYEANVAAIQAAKRMALKAMELGK